MSERLSEKEASVKGALAKPDEMEVIYLSRCASTMDEAKASLAHSEIPFVLFCDEQTDGRGRNGNEWEDTPKGIAGTFVLEAFDSHNECLGLSLVIGLSVARALKRSGVAVQSKWPNDLLDADGNKVGGILVELEERGGKVVPLIGLGLNIEDGPSGVAGASGLRVDREFLGFAAEIVNELWGDMKLFKQSGFAHFQSEFSQFGAFIGEEIALESDGETFSGVFAGVNTDGALLLRNNTRKGREFYSAQNIRKIS